MKTSKATSYRLYRLTHRRTGEIVILRHVGTSLGEDGGRIFWLCLADDPMQCLMSMSEDEVRQYDGVKLTYWGQCADQTGQLKHWFSALDGPWSEHFSRHARARHHRLLVRAAGGTYTRHHNT